MQSLALLIMTLGSLAIAGAPAWILLLGKLPSMAMEARRRSVVLVSVFVVTTVGLGIGWILAASALLRADAGPAWIWTGILLVASVPNVVLELRKRRRATRRTVWRADHADASVAPETRSERRASALLDQIVAAQLQSVATLRAQLPLRGWVTQSAVDLVEAGRLEVSLESSAFRRFLAEQPHVTRGLVEAWQNGVAAIALDLNRTHVEARRKEFGSFFDTVESSPLTEEQAEAVVCFDDRVRVMAAAGSGKTSTLVAKTVFAIETGLVQPKRILVLAFNRAAADSANSRISARLRERGTAGDSEITVQTFHGLGRMLTGRARGRMPSTPHWIDSDARRRERVAEIVRRLCENDTAFESDWRLFHAVYAGRETFDSPEQTPEPQTRLFTRRGIEVRSRGEQLIADWLWFRGVEFEYERPYDIDLATPEHRQYAPDFYYPSAAVWHEHFALDRFGAAPAHFAKYLEGVQWKRAQHREHGTTLVETTTADLDAGTALSRLELDLRAAGVVFDVATARVAPADPVEVGRTHDLLQKLLALVRVDGANNTALEALLPELPSATARMRARLLLRLLDSVRLEWQRDLDAADSIDFEGMVREANEALESGAVLPEYDLILVDEFQDLSPAFARLLRNLLRRSESRLFAVGDDWQAINGFAGADLGEMLQFHEHFGAGTTLRLQRTFRSSQAICDTAGAFVVRNPTQLSKEVLSGASPVPDGVRIRAVRDRAAQTRVLARYLGHLQGTIDSRRSRGIAERDRTVLVLGRYRWLSDLMPSGLRLPSIDVKFLTVHGAKGLEADHVVILDVAGGSDGFPSTKTNDPVLDLLLPAVEAFPSAEERRLFYVALTRARRSALVLTQQDSLSPFVHELVETGSPLQNEADERLEVCPDCQIGIVVQKNGRFGTFSLCSRRGCKYTRRSLSGALVINSVRDC